MNEGAALLVQAGTISETAKRLGCADRTVASWRTGRKLPSIASREQMLRELAIPVRAWDRRVEAAARPADEPQSAPAGELSEAPPEPREGAEQRLRAQLARLRAQRAAPDLSARDKLEIEKLELAASRQLARLEGLELTDARILRSAAWIRVRDCVVDALTPWPDAQRAVADALETRDA